MNAGISGKKNVDNEPHLSLKVDTIIFTSLVNSPD